MSQRDVIHNYLKILSNYLSRLDKSDSEEVIREIESHIYDVIDAQESKGIEVDAEKILSGFGDPRLLAADYSQHILHGTPPPNGFKAIQKVKKSVTNGLYYSMGIFGYGLAAALIALGVIKLFLPSNIGVWSAANGNSLMVSFSASAQMSSTELFGLWLVPMTLAIGIAIGYLTRRVMVALKEKL